MDIPSATSLEVRIQLAMRRIVELRHICSVPSISVGILHNGEVIHMESFGFHNVEQNLRADPDTLYLLSSLSKGFLSSTVGVAVAEGKMDWKTPIKRYIPEFNPSGPEGSEEANLIDCLRHSTGLSSPQMLILGPRGTLIHPEADFVQLMNTCPTSDQYGSRYNRWWSYNNWGCGLAAIALQRVYEQPYADILHERLLRPLNLSRTTVRSGTLRSDTNVAYPYVKLDNGTFYRLASDNWTYQDHAPANAVMGMRSCVREMLMWASSILEAEKTDLASTNTPTRPESFILPNIRDSGLNDNTVYCMGWYRTTIPSPMLGFLSYNDMTRDALQSSEGVHFVLGVASPKRELVAHNGVFCGSTSALYTFPETRSAIVVFANGLQDADAAEFAAQIIAQALFDLRPEVDILALARRESDLRKKHFTDTLLSDWEKNRDSAAFEYPKEHYIGKYEGHATTVSILQDSEMAGLCVQFNGIKESRLALEHYGKDIYSFFPTSRDEWLSNSMFEWNSHRLALLDFERDGSGDIVGLRWQWDHEGTPSWFQKG